MLRTTLFYLLLIKICNINACMNLEDVEMIKQNALMPISNTLAIDIKDYLKAKKIFEVNKLQLFQDDIQAKLDFINACSKTICEMPSFKILGNQIFNKLILEFVLNTIINVINEFKMKEDVSLEKEFSDEKIISFLKDIIVNSFNFNCLGNKTFLEFCQQYQNCGCCYCKCIIL